jgi:FHA domain
MSVSTCPNGHPSESSDYCDTCGTPIGQLLAGDASFPSLAGPAPVTPGTGAPVGGAGFPSPPGAPATPTTQPCPSCAMANAADALFCEACGYDFTTGTMPRPTSALDLGSAPLALTEEMDPDSEGFLLAQPVEVEWVAEVWVDPDWYAEQDSDEPCPSPGLPMVVALRYQSVLIGRRSQSRNILPAIDCASDVGVSRRQAQLTTDGQRWWVEDLQSSNGTFVGAASGPLPVDALRPGQRRELAEDDRVYLGAWTRIVVRRATPEEQDGTA